MKSLTRFVAESRRRHTKSSDLYLETLDGRITEIIERETEKAIHRFNISQNKYKLDSKDFSISSNSDWSGKKLCHVTIYMKKINGRLVAPESYPNSRDYDRIIKYLTSKLTEGLGLKASVDFSQAIPYPCA